MESVISEMSGMKTMISEICQNLDLLTKQVNNFMGSNQEGILFHKYDFI